MPTSPDNLISVADVLSSEVKDGEPRCKIGDSVLNKGIADNVPLYGQDGFVSLPNNPDVAGACVTIYIVEGNGKRLIGQRDNRYASKVGEMQPGDRMIVSRGEARFLMKADNDSITLFTENQKTGSSMVVSLDGTSGDLMINNGNSIVKIADKEITLAVNGGGALTITEDGVQIIGPKISACAATVLLGPFAPGVPAIPGVNSALIGPTGIAGAPSSSVMIHP